MGKSDILVPNTNYFLVLINSEGVIKKPLFTQLNHAKKLPHSLKSWLDNENIERFDNALSASEQEGVIEKLRILDSEYTIIYCLAGNFILLYGINQTLSEQSINIIYPFLRYVSEELIYHRNTSKQFESNFYFENIQKLNSDLLNKSREATKLNHELARLNKILNSRLVKDPLTGLVSRYQYHDEIMHMIHNHQSKKGIFCFIDLDDFKEINDNYGHHVGDQILVEFSRRLKHVNLENAIKMRISGDEFGIFIAGLDDVSTQDLDELTKTLKAVDKPYKIDNKEVTLTMSTGYAVYNEDTDDIYKLIEYADFAMYQAKRNKKGTAMKFDKSKYDKRHK